MRLPRPLGPKESVPEEGLRSSIRDPPLEAKTCGHEASHRYPPRCSSTHHLMIRFQNSFKKALERITLVCLLGLARC